MVNSSTRVYIDANILLDMIGKRPRLKQIMGLIDGKIVVTSSINVATAYYFARKDGVDNASFKEYTDILEIVPIDHASIDLAYNIAGINDLEDSLQIAACKKEGIGTLITADKQLSSLYSDELNIEFVE